MSSHERELRLARVTYVGAVRRLDAAMRDFDAAGIPFDPGPGSQPRRWTARHVAVMRELVAASDVGGVARRQGDASPRLAVPVLDALLSAGPGH